MSLNDRLTEKFSKAKKDQEAQEKISKTQRAEAEQNERAANKEAILGLLSDEVLEELVDLHIASSGAKKMVYWFVLAGDEVRPVQVTQKTTRQGAAEEFRIQGKESAKVSAKIAGPRIADALDSPEVRERLKALMADHITVDLKRPEMGKNQILFSVTVS